MSFIIILICLGVQWFCNFSSAVYQGAWSSRYVGWMRQTFSALIQGHGLFLLLTLVLPLVIIVSLVFTLTYHLLGYIGYLILSLLLLWYCTDVTGLRSSSIKAHSASELMLQSYQKVFAPLAWYFVCGPLGLTLYVVVTTLRSQFPIQKYFVLVSGALDWVPMRLVGLTFALAGNFAAVFKDWMKELLTGISDNQNQVVAWGETALISEKRASVELPDALSLMRRTLVIWLILIAVITVARWVG